MIWKNQKLDSVKDIDEYWKPNERINFEKILNISAKENLNVDKLCAKIREILDNLDDKERSLSKLKQQSNENESEPQKKTLKNLI